MGIHIPLSIKGQCEARNLMIATNNNMIPSNGNPNLTPSQDMILGCYFLTNENTSIYYLLEKIMCLNKFKISKILQYKIH